MSAEYSVEDVRSHAAMLDANQQIGAIGMIRKARDMLRAYAERIKADEGAVTDEVVERAIVAYARTASKHIPVSAACMRRALLAVWPTPPAQAAKADGDAPCAKCGSVSVDTGFECNDCGHDNAPTAEPAAQVDAMPEIRAWLADYADELDEQGFTDVAATIRTTAASIGASPTAEPVAQGNVYCDRSDCPCRMTVADCRHKKTRDTQPHSPDAADSGRAVGDAARLVALWRQPPDCDEEATLFDKGYEQASAECADELEAALAAQGQGEPIGEVRENGVTWFRDNPHAFPIGTRFYTAPAASPAGVPDGWKLVPIEPNESMRAAALTTDMPSIGEPPLYEKIWRRMLAAAPSPGES